MCLGVEFVLGPVNLYLLVAVNNNTILTRRTSSATITRMGIRRCGRVIEKRIMDSSAGRGFTKTEVDIMSAEVAAVASSSKVFRLGIPRAGIALTISTPNCLPRVVSIGKHDGIGVRLLRSARTDDFCSGAILSTGGTDIMAGIAPSVTDVSRSFSAHLDKRLHSMSRSKTAKGKTTIFVHKLGSLGVGTRPLCVISKTV